MSPIDPRAVGYDKKNRNRLSTSFPKETKPARPWCVAAHPPVRVQTKRLERSGTACPGSWAGLGWAGPIAHDRAKLPCRAHAQSQSARPPLSLPPLARACHPIDAFRACVSQAKAAQYMGASVYFDPEM